MPGIVDLLERQRQASKGSGLDHSPSPSSGQASFIIPRTPSLQVITENAIIESSFIDLTQSIVTTPEEYRNVLQLVEDIWFNIDSPNHQNEQDPFQEANNRYAKQLLGF